jgi:hypothetical protein
MSEPITLAVTLHHLAPDVKQAGVNFPDVEHKDVTPPRLRGWLEALAKLAPKIEFPTQPELRIVGPRGRFLVQVKNGQVRLTSWSTNEGGSDLTPEELAHANWPLKRPPFHLETSLPGVFAVGDVRSGNVKRVASAVGEGSVAVSLVHRFLAE